MTWDASKIPRWLRRTPEQQKADDALQARLRSAYGPGIRPTSTERHLMRARAVELSARAQLEHAQTDPHAKELHIVSARAQLAEARAAQGHFTEAAEIHPDERHCKRYTAIAAAVERPDDETCDCPAETRVPHPADGKTITIQNQNVDEIVFSRKHNRLMPLIACTDRDCGHMNVRPAPQALQRRLSNLKTRESA